MGYSYCAGQSPRFFMPRLRAGQSPRLFMPRFGLIQLRSAYP